MDAGFYARLVDESDEFVYVVETDGTIRYAGGATVAIVGWRPEERVGRGALDCVLEDDRAAAAAALAECVAAGPDATVRIRCRVRAKAGGLRWIDAAFRNDLATPAVRGVVVRGRDVTGVVALRVRSERAELLQALMENSRDAILVVEPDGCILEAFGAREAGWSYEELAGLPAFELVHPDDRERAAARFARHVAEPGLRGTFDAELRIRRRDGGWMRCVVAASNHVADAAIRGIVVCLRDVTEQRRAEERLRRAERRFDAALWSADLGLWELQCEVDDFRWLNDWCGRHDIDPCEGIGQTPRWDARIHPDDLPSTLVDYEAHLRGETPFYETEYRVRTLGGDWRWIRSRARVVERDADGRPQLMLGSTVDVDAQKRTAAELETRRRQLESLASAGPMWMYLLDREGHVEYASRSILGESPERLAGRPADSLLADPVEAARMRRFNEAVVATRLPAVHSLLLPDGRTIETHATAIVEGGEVTGIAAVSLDVSERRQLERALVEAVAREQRRVGHDLHDGLGQELTGIALLLRGLLAHGAPPRVAAGVEEVMALVNGAIETTREVARGLAPVAAAQGGLACALHALAARWAGAGGPEVSCRVADRADDGVDPLVAEHLHRIAQEAVTNAVRHAGARRVRVQLARARGVLELRVEDDGRGLPADADRAPGLGLKIMRARAELIRGRLAVERRRPRGTRVVCAWDPGPSPGDGVRSYAVAPPAPAAPAAGAERSAAGGSHPAASDGPARAAAEQR